MDSTNNPANRGFYTPNNNRGGPPSQHQQRNTVNIPFYRDTSQSNRNFGGTPYNNQNRRGGFNARRFNNNYTPRHNNHRPHFQPSRGNVDISQFYHPSMLEDPWKDLIDDDPSSSSQPPQQQGIPTSMSPTQEDGDNKNHQLI